MWRVAPGPARLQSWGRVPELARLRGRSGNRTTNLADATSARQPVKLGARFPPQPPAPCRPSTTQMPPRQYPTIRQAAAVPLQRVHYLCLRSRFDELQVSRGAPLWHLRCMSLQISFLDEDLRTFSSSCALRSRQRGPRMLVCSSHCSRQGLGMVCVGITIRIYGGPSLM